MPHFIAKSLSSENLKSNELIQFVASSDEVNLIGVKVKDKEFLLSEREKNSNYLVKYEKVTRVSDKELIKEALLKYASLKNADIISSNINQKFNIHKSDKYEKDINYFVNDFKTDKEVWIEIGFGTGRHLLHQAKENPNIEFIGIEIYKPSVEILSKHLKIEGVENVHILNYDARIFMEFLKSNSVGKIFVHFPVPWDKKPHRRVFSKNFIDEAIRILKVNGTLELRTDSQNYFDYSLELFLNYNQLNFEIKKNIDLKVSSKYEDRWKKQEKNIYDLTLKNIEFSNELKIEVNFSFSKLNFNSIFENFKNITFKEENFILHFENIYRIGENSGLIKVTLGSFDKPESKYIYISKESKYYQSNPIASKANLKAHKKIDEYLKCL